MSKQCSGNLYIVAAPSGAGKTSLVKELVQSLTEIAISVSHTTRLARPGEKDGVDYYYVTPDIYATMVANGDFIEHAQVYGHAYGTSKQQLLSRLQNGTDVVLDIDWQGAQQIKRAFPDAVGVFIVPPSLEVLRQRLILRCQDSEETIVMRMKSAQNELSHYNEFDYLIVNDDFTEACNELRSIVISNRQRLTAQMQRNRKLLSFLLS